MYLSLNVELARVFSVVHQKFSWASLSQLKLITSLQLCVAVLFILPLMVLNVRRTCGIPCSS